MRHLVREVDCNFESFFNDFKASIVSNIDDSSYQKSVYKDSYRRLVSFQAWKSNIIESLVSEDVKAFFLEAQNDALVSHMLARQKAWRVSLICLRNCIENILVGLYYSDHPIELKLWNQGLHKLGFSECITYLLSHPDFPKRNNLDGLERIKKEYAVLSRAVHGSSKEFRMTKTGLIEGMNSSSSNEIGKWAARERETVESLNLVLITFFRFKMQGSANLNLRKAISFSIADSRKVDIKAKYKVNLFLSASL